MKNLSLKQSKRQKYNSVSSDDRQKIIKMFLENDYSAIQIAHLTGHNLSTIKAIYRIYKNEGRINKKERRDRQINIQQNVVVLMVDEKQLFNSIMQNKKNENYKEIIIKARVYHEEYRVYLRIYSEYNTIDINHYTINQTFQNSTADIIKQLDSLSSKQCFNQLIKKGQIEGLDIKDFKEISEITNKFKNRIKISSQLQYFQNLFSKSELHYQEKQPQPTQKLQQFLNSDINDLKRIFEFQIKDYFLKSKENLK